MVSMLRSPMSQLRVRAILRWVLPASLLVLAACNGVTAPPPAEGIGFRQARHDQLAAVEGYRACRDEALLLDRKARSDDATARYLASARVLERCEAELGSHAAAVPVDERMRVVALTVQNRLKGGDVAAARAALDRFRQAFPGQDLYYVDGSSFSETMDLLLGMAEPAATGRFAVANVGATAKAELRRLTYWKRH